MSSWSHPVLPLWSGEVFSFWTTTAPSQGKASIVAALFDRLSFAFWGPACVTTFLSKSIRSFAQPNGQVFGGNPLFIFHSFLHTLIARPGTRSCSLLRPHLTFSNSQSVKVTTLLVLSNPLLSSECSIVWLAIRPFESNVKMKRPVKSSPLLIDRA